MTEPEDLVPPETPAPIRSSVSLDDGPHTVGEQFPGHEHLVAIVRVLSTFIYQLTGQYFQAKVENNKGVAIWFDSCFFVDSGSEYVKAYPAVGPGGSAPSLFGPFAVRPGTPEMLFRDSWRVSEFVRM